MKKYRDKAWAFILNEEDEVLMVHHDMYKPGEWTFPGGGVEKGETHLHALKRELFEELGIIQKDYDIIKKSDYVATYHFSKQAIKYFKKFGEDYVGAKPVTFLLKASFKIEDLIPDGNEIKDYSCIKWVSKLEFKKYMVFDGQYENAMKFYEELQSVS